MFERVRGWFRGRRRGPHPPPIPIDGERPASFTADVAELGDWQLPTNRPVVVLAQLDAQYDGGRTDDGRIRHRRDDDYDAKLISALRFASRRQAHFIVFPEYAFPLRLASDVLRTLEQELPVASACLVPFEHISLEDYRHLLDVFPVAPTVVSSVHDEIGEGRSQAAPESAIVNVCFSFLRVASGNLVAIPQLKMRPAGLEETGLGRWQFYPGRTVRIVRGQGCSYGVSVCFDFIARDEGVGERPRSALAEHILDIVFVPECNPSPFNRAYFQAILDLFGSDRWSRSHSCLLFCNVADRTILRGVPSPAAFGYSRVIGSLGRVGGADPPLFKSVEGVLVLDPFRGLHELEGSSIEVHPLLRTVVARPREALLECRMPTLGMGAPRDPAAGRFGTEVRLFRRVSDIDAEWQEVRPARRLVEPAGATGIPPSFLVEGGLIGVKEIAEALEEALRGPGVIWVTGQGGIGKTVLLADVLHYRFEEPGTARVLWTDMARVPPSEEALLEELLLALGKPAGIGQELADQWRILQEECDRRTTIIVLDSIERWPHKPSVPAELRRRIRYPSRLVLLSRRRAPSSESDVNVEVNPLEPSAVREVLERAAGQQAPDAIASALYAAIGGNPLGAIWVGGTWRRSPEAVASLVDSLREGPDLVGPGDELRRLFEWSLKQASPFHGRLLAVLCELPVAVSVDDLAPITGGTRDEVRAAVQSLVGNNFILEEVWGEARASGAHTNHPFVRQFWESVQRTDVWPALVDWATRFLDQYGGDRNWNGYDMLQKRWPNVRHILDGLREGPRRDARRFLSLWRRADYFLWSKGRWRERIELGVAAERGAEELGDRELLAHALYDSIAETKWHRGGSRAEAEAYLRRARDIYAELGDTTGCAMVDYYRARLLRAKGVLEEAARVAEEAVQVAERAADARVLGLALNAQGNAKRSLHDLEGARRCYERATPIIEGAQDLEMSAVLKRNLGRVFIEEGRLGMAVENLERAMDRFADLGLTVEEAETAVYHASALVRLGERDSGESELAWALETLQRNGARRLQREADAVRQELRQGFGRG